MNKKVKRSQARVTFVIAAFFLLFLGILFACLIAYIMPTEPRYPEALITAEYLEEYPLQTPPFMTIDQDCFNAAPHCFTIFLDSFSALAPNYIQRRNMARSLVLTIDGDVQRVFSAYLIDGQLHAEIPSLASGLHLIDIEI